MQKSFTLEDLAKYSLEVYFETQWNMDHAVKKAGPGALAVRNILQYSKALTVRKTKAGESMFLLMN